MTEQVKFFRKFVLLALIGLSSLAYSQSVGIIIDRGDAAFEDEFYLSAIQQYEAALTEQGLGDLVLLPYSEYGRASDTLDYKLFLPVIDRLAESYRQIYDYPNAEKWFKIHTDLVEEDNPELLYRYALTLRANKKFPAALEILREAESERIPSDLAEKIRFEIQCAEFAKEAVEYPEAHEVKVKDELVFNPINSGNYAPSHIYGNDFLFTTTRETRPRTGDEAVKYYHSLKVYQNGNLYDYEFEGLDPEKEYEIAAASITGDEKRLYFNMWVPDGKKKDPEKNLQLYMSIRVNDVTWSAPMLLDTLLGTEEGVENKFPFITKDGSKLYFSSERKDGLGGLDIYEISVGAEGYPLGEVRNLGSAINTNGNEISPFYEEKNNILYFASDGRVGMGGYDNFMTENKGGGWSKAQNLGAPMNSSKDDAFLIITDKNAKGMFASDRLRGCCYEIFDFTLFYKSGTGYVFNQFDYTPVENAKITLTDTVTGKVLATTRSNVDGKYVFEIQEDRYYQVDADHPNYFDGKAFFTSVGVTGKDTAYIPDMVIIPTDTGKPVVLDNILYDFGSDVLRPESYPVLDFLAEQLIKRPLLRAEVGSHTDAIGSEAANENLSMRRSRSVVEYLQMQGVPEAQITYRGYGESQPIAPNENPDGSDNPEGRQLNRRTEFKILAVEPATIE